MSGRHQWRVVKGGRQEVWKWTTAVEFSTVDQRRIAQQIVQIPMCSAGWTIIASVNLTGKSVSNVVQATKTSDWLSCFVFLESMPRRTIDSRLGASYYGVGQLDISSAWGASSMISSVERWHMLIARSYTINKCILKSVAHNYSNA